MPKIDLGSERLLDILKDEFPIIEEFDIDRTDAHTDVIIRIKPEHLEGHEYRDLDMKEKILDWAHEQQSRRGEPCLHHTDSDCVDDFVYEDVRGYGVSAFGFGGNVDFSSSDSVYACSKCEMIIRRF
jgi:hypothetical protein